MDVFVTILILISLGEFSGAVNRVRQTIETPARPSVTSDTVYFEEGDTVTLYCNSSTPGITSYEWRQYGVNLVPGVHTQTYTFSATYVYGWKGYACRVYVGDVVSDWSVDIQLNFELRQSTLSSSAQQGTVKEGSSVTFTCTPPNPELYFYPYFYRDGNIVNTEFGNFSTFTISDLTTEDTGAYTCKHFYVSAMSEPLWMLVAGETEARIDDAYQPLQYEGKMYYINQDSFTDYQDAVDRCQFEGGILAEINDEDEFFTIQNYLNNVMHNFSYVYIGGTDLAKEGDWVLQTTNQPLPYTNWYMFHPLQSDKANCLSLTSFSNWEMFSFVCSFGSPNPVVHYLCEKEVFN